MQIKEALDQKLFPDRQSDTTYTFQAGGYDYTLVFQGTDYPINATIQMLSSVLSPEDKKEFDAVITKEKNRLTGKCAFIQFSAHKNGRDTIEVLGDSNPFAVFDYICNGVKDYYDRHQQNVSLWYFGGVASEPKRERVYSLLAKRMNLMYGGEYKTLTLKRSRSPAGEAGTWFFPYKYS